MALSFTPTSSQYVDIGLAIPSLNAKPACTVMAWVNWNAFTATQSISEQAIGPPPGISGTSRVFFNILATAAIQLGVRPDDAGASTILNSGGGAISAGVWNHVAAVANIANDAMTIYVNGAQIASSTPAFTPTTFPATDSKNGTLGANDDATGQFADGMIADFRMYDRALRLEEIQSIYHMRGTDGIRFGLVQGWLLNEGAPGVAAVGAGSVKDRSAFQRNINPVNSPVYQAGPTRFRRRVW